MCPKNTYSTGGNFRVNGNYNEWTNENLAKFNNECYLKTKSQEYSNCSPMTNANKHYIKSDNSLNVVSINYMYISQLSKTFTLVKPGNLIFIYKKDTIKNRLERNGIFSLYINYQIEINDSDLNCEFKSVSIPLQPGKYTILWEYIKSVYLEAKEMALTIESIEVTGLDSAARECISCSYGFAEPGSDHCSLCSESQYLNTTMNKCVACPEGTYNPSNDECVPIQSCIPKDYNYIYSYQCNRKTNKMRVKYEITNPLCKKEKIENEIDCNDCLPGQYIHKLANNYYQCNYCPMNTYSEGVNFLNCRGCVDGVSDNAMYIYPNNSFYFESNEIETIDENGSLNIVFNADDTHQEKKIETMIDSQKRITTTSNEDLFIKLEQGKHKIKITIASQNIAIKYIKVSHSSTGGRYNCIKSGKVDETNKDTQNTHHCSPGFRYNVDLKECQKCGVNEYKSSNDDSQCRECPILTYPDEKHSNCIPYHVINQNTHMMKVNIGNIEMAQGKICTLIGSLCNINFYGPLRDKNQNMFYISFFSAKAFQSNDLTYKFNSNTSKIPSFIYMLNSSDAHTHSSTTKLVSSIGQHIDYLKFVKGASSRGIVIHYIDGDVCDENINQTYESYLYLNCTKQNEDVLSFVYPRFISRNKCTFYFEWSSKEACPICLRSEVSVHDMPCKSNTRKIFYLEGDKCIISDTTNMIGDNINHTDESLMITAKEANLVKQFKLDDITEEIKKEEGKGANEDYYIMNGQTSEPCFYMFEMDIFMTVIIIAVPTIYLIVVITCVVVFLKYRKIKGTYHVLVETADSREVTETKAQDQLEIVSSRHNEEPIEGINKINAEEHSLEVKIRHNENQAET